MPFKLERGLSPRVNVNIQCRSIAHRLLLLDVQAVVRDAFDGEGNVGSICLYVLFTQHLFIKLNSVPLARTIFRRLVLFSRVIHRLCNLLYDVGGEFYSIYLFQYGEVDGYNAVFLVSPITVFSLERSTFLMVAVVPLTIAST